MYLKGIVDRNIKVKSEYRPPPFLAAYVGHVAYHILIKPVDFPQSFIVHVSHPRMIYFSLMMLCAIVSCRFCKTPGYHKCLRNSHQLIVFSMENWYVGLRVEHNVKKCKCQVFHFLHFFKWDFHGSIVSLSGIYCFHRSIVSQCSSVCKSIFRQIL